MEEFSTPACRNILSGAVLFPSPAIFTPAAKTSLKALQTRTADQMSLILKNCMVFDGVSEVVRPGLSLFIEDGVIRDISERAIKSDAAETLDLGGRFVMPGLIDAHFHAYGTETNPAKIDQMPPALRALYARKILEDTLQRGFTTIRDAAGGDFALARGIERGLIAGPRFYYPGLAISQTGGHGDSRAPGEPAACMCGYCGALSIVADGVDEVRRTVREQLRHGATHVKLFASGGVLSPSDPFWMNQFSEEEIRVTVEEAATRRTYVMAHAHTNDAIIRCLRNGVRSIEHATAIEDDGVRELVAHDAFAVPTLVIIDQVMRAGPSLGLTPAMLDKMQALSRTALESLDRLRTAGAKIGFGTDLLGSIMPMQSHEFSLRRAVCTPLEILRSATSVNADLIQMTGKLGVLAPQAYADLLVIDGNPLTDIAVLEDHARIGLIMKEGVIHKNTLAS